VSYPTRAPTADRPEQRALLLCARVNLDGSAREQLIALARDGLDYAALVREAENHGLVPLLSRHLHALAPDLRSPPALLAGLRNSAEHSVRASLALAGDLVGLLAALRAVDVPALAIKGPISAALCYGDLGLRTFSDLDLLIDAAHVERASRCLAELGYAPVFAVPPGWLQQLVRSDTERLYCHADGVRLVDLHWELLPRGYTFSPATEGLFATTQSVRIGAAEVPTLGTEATLIFLLLHGIKHDWSSLGWLCDVAELIRRQRDLDWSAVLAWSDKAGPRRFIDIGLALAHQLLDAPVPERVLQRGARDPMVAHVAGALAARLSDPTRDDAPSVIASSIGLTYFRAMQRRRDQLRFLHDVVLRPTPLEWRALPLPPRLAPLHYFVRPVRLLWKHARLR
jgi:hypothetical protein